MPDFSHLTLDERKSHFRNLVAAASKDGVVGYEERVALAYAARKWGLQQADADQITAKPEAVPLILPASREARFHQLYDVVEMMMIDGEIKRVEREMCTALSTRLGFAPTIVDTIKRAILDGNRAGLTEDKIQADLLRRI